MDKRPKGGGAKQIVIPKSMAYGEEEGEDIRLEIRKVEFKDERDKKEREELEKIRHFLKRIKWRKLKKKDEEEEQKQRGITWIELFALYTCKGVGKEEQQKEKETPLEKKKKMQVAILAFNLRLSVEE